MWPTGLLGDVTCPDTVAAPYATSRSWPEPDCAPTVAVLWVRLESEAPWLAQNMDDKCDEPEGVVLKQLEEDFTYSVASKPQPSSRK